MVGSCGAAETIPCCTKEQTLAHAKLMVSELDSVLAFTLVIDLMPCFRSMCDLLGSTPGS